MPITKLSLERQAMNRLMSVQPIVGFGNIENTSREYYFMLDIWCTKLNAESVAAIESAGFWIASVSWERNQTLRVQLIDKMVSEARVK